MIRENVIKLKYSNDVYSEILPSIVFGSLDIGWDDSSCLYDDLQISNTNEYYASIISEDLVRVNYINKTKGDFLKLAESIVYECSSFEFAAQYTLSIRCTSNICKNLECYWIDSYIVDCYFDYAEYINLDIKGQNKALLKLLIQAIKNIEIICNIRLLAMREICNKISQNIK